MNLKNSLHTRIMMNGNKQTAEKLFLKSLKKLQKLKVKKEIENVIKLSIINSSPIVFIKRIKRKRKRTVEFPFLLNSSARVSYGIKFIIQQCKSTNTQPFYYNFALECENSANFESISVKKKTLLHQDSFSKKKFATYRWF